MKLPIVITTIGTAMVLFFCQIVAVTTIKSLHEEAHAPTFNTEEISDIPQEQSTDGSDIDKPFEIPTKLPYTEDDLVVTPDAPKTDEIPEPVPVVTNQAVPQNVQPEPAQQSAEPTQGSGNFAYDGVWRDDKWTYKWYSSNTLYHYRTGEWTPDAQGVYRDAEGYAVVASSDLAQGSVIESTPFGKAKVYDAGCPSGIVDVYVNY